MRHSPRCLATGLAALALAPSAQAQSLSGSWQVVVADVSNTCDEPLGPAEALPVTIHEAGGLVAIDVDRPDQTPVEGDRSGTTLRLGFEVFEDGGVTVHDPATTLLSVNAAATSFSGLMPWSFYSPAVCTGTQTWSATRPSVTTPGSLAGSNWTIRVTETSDSCDAIDPSPVDVPVSIVHAGSLVEVLAPDFGQTRLRGRVSGQTLRLGLAIAEAGGDFTVFDAADNPLAIAANLRSFSGTMTWTAFAGLECTGVDRVTAYLPEPGVGAGVAAATALAGSLGALTASRPRARRAGRRAGPRARAPRAS